MSCFGCGHTNPDGTRFCEACGRVQPDTSPRDVDFRPRDVDRRYWAFADRGKYQLLGQDVYLADADEYDEYESHLQPNTRFEDKKLRDAGYANLLYKATPVVLK